MMSLNAIEAMTESGGTLWVSVTSLVKSVSGTDKVRVEFRDSGNGISSAMISRIFDPFFTTKPSGTGLGLSICHEFVRAHGGEIQVESAEGDGTSVRIILPVRDKIAEKAPRYHENGHESNHSDRRRRSQSPENSRGDSWRERV